MDKKDRNILIGAGAIGAFLLLSGKKKKSSIFPVTEDSDSDKAKKNSPYYFGDKSDNAVYDPFYDYSSSSDQRDIMEVVRSGSNFANSAVEKAFRVRIVPNSLAMNPIGSVVLQMACIIEIFNPFAYTLDPTYMSRLNDIYLSNLKMVDSNNVVRNIDIDFLRGTDINQGLISYLNKYNYFEAVNPVTGREYKYENYIFGGRSLFIPQSLSMTPSIEGNFPRTIYRSTQQIIAKLINDTTTVSFDVHFQLSSSNYSVTNVLISQAETEATYYVYKVGKSVCQTTQSQMYMGQRSFFPIYLRPQVKKHLLPYHHLPANSDVKNGLLESINILGFKGYRDVTPNLFGLLNFT